MTSSCRFEDVHDHTDDNVKPTVHYVPFKVEYDGPANVKDKFTDTARPHSDLPQVLTNRFRGRPLAGQKIEFTGNYEGMVLENSGESSKGLEEKDEGEGKNGKTLRVVNRFDSMTYWNWDKNPSAMDNPVKLNDWLELSALLHEPVSK